MSVPDYQKFMLPILKITGDRQQHSSGEVIDTVARQFGLSEQDLSEMLPSGTQAKFPNRVVWAVTYLTKAGLLERTGRGKFRITDRGFKVLSHGVSTIDAKFLKQFPEFLEFQKGNRPFKKEEESEGEDTQRTPFETLEFAYQDLRRALALDVLDRVKRCSPKFCEQLVVDLLVAIGYGGSRKDAAQAVGRSGDDGVDGIIKEDKLGLDVVYIQAKRWQATVGRPTVQEFAGSLEGHRARKGVLITTSRFSQDAKGYVDRIEKKIVLIDGEQLAQLMIDHGIGVADIANYPVKKVDSDYFGEE